MPSPWKPPNFVTLEVTETDPGFKGDTASNTLPSPQLLETGYSPARCRCSSITGDMIRIDTRTGEYMERG